MAAGDHRILIYDKSRCLIEEVDGIADREWLFDRVNTLKLTMPIGDPKITDKNFHLGNHIVVLSDDVIPWAGVQWMPVSEGQDEVSFSALGGRMYLERRTIRGEPPRGTTVAGMVEWIMKKAQERARVPITISDNSDVQANNMSRVEKGLINHGMTCRAALDTLADAQGAEWWLDAITDNFELRWELHFRQRKEILGVDLVVGGLSSGVSFDGKNARVLSGDLVNAIEIIERVEGGSEAGYFEAGYSIDEYGLWGSSNYQGYRSWEQERRRSKRKLEDQSLPYTRYKLKINPNIDQGITRTLETGALHNLILPDVGFFVGSRGTHVRARLLAFGYSEIDGTVDVILETQEKSEKEEIGERQRWQGHG